MTFFLNILEDIIFRTSEGIESTQPYYTTLEFLHVRDVVTNLVVVVVDAPFLCLTAPPPPARGEEPVRGEPAPTFVLLAAGPTIIIKIERKN